MEAFTTTIVDIRGSWPELPSNWSFSSLKEAEECPRRWMLSRAHYEGLWDEPGYPQAPVLRAIVGTVIHNVLEQILRELHADACPSLNSPASLAVMRRLGGFTRVLEAAVDAEYEDLRLNPRAQPRLETLRTATLNLLPEMREKVQAILSRAELDTSDRARSTETPGSGLSPLSRGSRPEVTLCDPDLRFTGRADLLAVGESGCEIVDYKTGVADPHHVEQVRTYALLWTCDRRINDRDLPVTKLVLAYATHEQRVDVPSKEDLEELRTDLRDRIGRAEADLQTRPPIARPSVDHCIHCGVRHLCDDYWEAPPAGMVATDTSADGDFVDAEVVVLARNGPRSWRVGIGQAETAGLLRTQTEDVPLRPGTRFRVTRSVFNRDEDSATPILTGTQASELFQVASADT